MTRLWHRSRRWGHRLLCRAGRCSMGLAGLLMRGGRAARGLYIADQRGISIHFLHSDKQVTYSTTTRHFDCLDLIIWCTVRRRMKRWQQMKGFYRHWHSERSLNSASFWLARKVRSTFWRIKRPRWLASSSRFNDILFWFTYVCQLDNETMLIHCGETFVGTA